MSKLRYPDCINPNSNCEACSLSNYNRDCRNNPTNHLAYLRFAQGLTQAELAKESGVNIRQIRRYENDTSSCANMTLQNAVSIAVALGVQAEDLLG